MQDRMMNSKRRLYFLQIWTEATEYLLSVDCRSIALTVLLGIATALVSYSTCAIAANVSHFDLGSRRTIVLDGEIVEGDAEKIKALAKGKYVRDIVMASPGGDVLEAMKISEFLNDRYIIAEPTGDLSKDPSFVGLNLPSRCVSPILDPEITARVSALVTYDNCGCVSSCALILLTAPSRPIETFYSFVGVHRPYFIPDYYAGLSEAAAKKSYRKMLKGVEAFLDSNDVPRTIVDIMISNASNQVHFLTKEEGKLLGDRKPYIQELLFSRCQKYSRPLATYQDLSDRLDAAIQRALAHPGIAQYQSEADSIWDSFFAYGNGDEYSKALQCVMI